MVIKRRAALMAVVAAVAAVLAGLYLWRFAQAQAGIDLFVGTVLVVVGCGHAIAWRHARTPILVADERGLRVRLGGSWTGIPWADVRNVQVKNRARLRDGRITVQVNGEGKLLSGLGPVARWACRFNRWWYDEALAVSYGVTTSVSTSEVVVTLRGLADGRAEIVDAQAEPVAPEPTVELTSNSESSPQETPPEPPARPRPLGDRVVSALRGSAATARRHEVSLPVSHGSLALADPDDVHVSTTLPEEEDLRRQPEEADRSDDPEHDTGEDTSHGTGQAADTRTDVRTGTVTAESPDAGNVELVIDATTDLSARAMQRRAGARTVPDEAVEDPQAPADAAATAPSLVIGNQLREGRERLGLSVDDLAQRTRIRPHVLEALEVDDFAPCGGDFYARGHLRMLARILGVEADPLVQTYDRRFATDPVSPRQVFDADRSGGGSGMLRSFAGGPRWGVLAAAVLVLLLVWGLATYFVSDNGPNRAVTSSHNAVGLGSPGVGNEPLPSTGKVSVRLHASGGKSHVVVTNRSHQTVYVGVLGNGESRTVSAEAPLHIEAANGGVVALKVDGHSRGTVGTSGHRATVTINGSANRSG